MTDKIQEDKPLEATFASVIPDSGGMQVEETEKTAQTDPHAAEGPSGMQVEMQDDSSEDDEPLTPRAYPIPVAPDAKGKARAMFPPPVPISGPSSSKTANPHPPLKGMKALQVYHLLQNITALVLERPITYGEGTLVFGTKCMPWRKQKIDMQKIYKQEPGFEGKVDLPTLRSKLRDQWNVYVCKFLIRSRLIDNFLQPLRSFQSLSPSYYAYLWPLNRNRRDITLTRSQVGHPNPSYGFP